MTKPRGTKTDEKSIDSEAPKTGASTSSIRSIRDRINQLNTSSGSPAPTPSRVPTGAGARPDFHALQQKIAEERARAEDQKRAVAAEEKEKAKRKAGEISDRLNRIKEAEQNKEIANTSEEYKRAAATSERQSIAMSKHVTSKLDSLPLEQAQALRMFAKEELAIEINEAKNDNPRDIEKQKNHLKLMETQLKIKSFNSEALSAARAEARENLAKAAARTDVPTPTTEVKSTPSPENERKQRP